MSLWNRRKFGIAQRHRRQLTFQEAYHIRDVDTNEDIAWSKRDRIGLKTNIHVYDSETTQETNKVLLIRDEAIFDAFGKFRVLDSKTGEELAVIKRHWFRSLFREKYTIRDPRTGEELVTCQARSLLVSLIRNFRWLPIFGYADFFIQFIRLQWDFFDRKTLQKLGEFNRKFTIRDNYVLDVTPDVSNVIDSRVALAIAILLDSAEKR